MEEVDECLKAMQLFHRIAEDDGLYFIMCLAVDKFNDSKIGMFAYVVNVVSF